MNNSNNKLTERVVVEQEVTGVIRDLVMFARYLSKHSRGVPVEKQSDADLLDAARNYWDREHGE